jgi:hypothetical protein
VRWAHPSEDAGRVNAALAMPSLVQTQVVSLFYDWCLS